MVEDVDPTTIEDERLRQVCISLMNLLDQESERGSWLCPMQMG